MRKTNRTSQEITRRNRCMKENPDRYIQSKIDNIFYCYASGEFKRHLNSHNMTFKDYWEIYETGATPLCDCLKPLRFRQKTRSYAKSCDSKSCIDNLCSLGHLSRTPEEVKKSSDIRRATNMKKYGYESVSHVQSVKDTSKKSREKIMPDGRTWGEHIQDMARAGKKRKHGDEFYNNSQQISKTKRLFTPEKNAAINKKRDETNLAKYGVKHTLLLCDRSKSGMGNQRFKDYTLPSGKIVKVRGYEPRALNILLKEYSEDQIIIAEADNLKSGKSPQIRWVDKAEKVRTYYPDIYIPDENLLIEVKSRWWLDGNGNEKHVDRLEANLTKKKYSIDSGYNHIIWVFESDGSITYV